MDLAGQTTVQLKLTKERSLWPQLYKDRISLFSEYTAIQRKKCTCTNSFYPRVVIYILSGG